MQDVAGEPVKHIRELAIMGFVEVVMNLRSVLGNIKLCKQDIFQFKPDAIIGIDYPGFNLKIAKFAHENGLTYIHYISPQLWAWKKRRIKSMRKHLDSLCYILPFEQDFYAKNHFPQAVYVGHPLLDAVEQFETVEQVLRDKPVIALLPGSRKQELKRTLEPMLYVAQRHPEYDFIIGRGSLNRRIGEKISEATGRRVPLEMDIPVGLSGCLEWAESMAGYDPAFAALAPSAEKALRERFDRIAEAYRPSLEGRRVIIYCVMVRDLKWQVETLKALGADIRAVMFVDGPVIDHNVRIPDYGDVKVLSGTRMCDLRRMVPEEGAEIVLTNDSDRVRREGFRYAPLGTRYYGMEGVEEWARTLVDSLSVPIPTWEGGL